SVTLVGDTAERTVRLSSAGRLFTIGSSVTLTLDNNVTLQGLTNNTVPLVQVNSGGTLMMKTGSKITGNNGGASGGGVYVSGGTFTMSGGIISGNSATGTSTSGDAGGGVYVSGGTFEMSGGTISDNTASGCYSSGGGVYMNGTFKKESGGIIYGSNETGNDTSGNPLKNTASNGHAVYTYSGKKRDTTAGVGVTLDGGTDTNWE
ncbi:MAG: hypothetical protein LBD79_00310, partial [Treponema sp.]|nr:hypothetical protein [Treponema sp.]